MCEVLPDKYYKKYWKSKKKIKNKLKILKKYLQNQKCKINKAFKLI